MSHTAQKPLAHLGGVPFQHLNTEKNPTFFKLSETEVCTPVIIHMINDRHFADQISKNMFWHESRPMWSWKYNEVKVDIIS